VFRDTKSLSSAQSEEAKAFPAGNPSIPNQQFDNGSSGRIPMPDCVTSFHPFAGLARLYWWSLILKAFATDSIFGRDRWHIRITSSFRRMED